MRLDKPFALSFALFLSVGTIASSQSKTAVVPADTTTNTVIACVNMMTAIPRIVTATTACNTATEILDEWNITGPVGPAGPIGLVGLTGATGAVGPAGPAGPVGVRGLPGATGPVGPRGVTGLTGATGPRGLTGVAGPAGVRGLPGASGPVGPRGVTGLTGPAGPRGLQGLTGPEGAKGVAGATGATGPTGPVGARGLPGSVNPIPANITALSGALGTNGYSNEDFTYNATCMLGDAILSVNSYGEGALPADGRLLPINQNVAVFSIMGTRFGGDGITTFGLPDLRPFAPQGMQYSICVLGIYPSRN
ncbi:tail fiber protein [Acidicapsa ligni]|uniref:tail fiber protein n=1 Tax=Acidicapsa ligni TaxID=542300 RepID=UPI0021E0558E|nr:tail fiber protein [Acidicapsa ligni]